MPLRVHKTDGTTTVLGEDGRITGNLPSSTRPTPTPGFGFDAVSEGMALTENVADLQRLLGLSHGDAAVLRRWAAGGNVSDDDLVDIISTTWRRGDDLLLAQGSSSAYAGDAAIALRGIATHLPPQVRERLATHQQVGMLDIGLD